MLLISTIAFIFLKLFSPENYYLFITFSVILRIFQGIASSAIQIAAYSFATNEMNKEKDTYIGYVEMACGVGDMIGPSIGGLVY